MDACGKREKRKRVASMCLDDTINRKGRGRGGESEQKGKVTLDILSLKGLWKSVANKLGKEVGQT